ncbi:unnamed protein product [Prunus armeniaca]|uniref:Uncharacterized protein n=1 Tax=Prunus armeniaca TaxID=36596 RepID=A0A6J5TW29_PRUAR|nr:unnamed protein product [Prunus armeniaca]CAB4298663.1 unnamed protein product [Prunus armeniaca]
MLSLHPLPHLLFHHSIGVSLVKYGEEALDQEVNFPEMLRRQSCNYLGDAKQGGKGKKTTVLL